MRAANEEHPEFLHFLACYPSQDRESVVYDYL